MGDLIGLGEPGDAAIVEVNVIGQLPGVALPMFQNVHVHATGDSNVCRMHALARC
jgi:hypothetical protein